MGGVDSMWLLQNSLRSLLSCRKSYAAIVIVSSKPISLSPSPSNFRYSVGKMAFLLNKNALSALRIHPQRDGDSSMLSRRGFHVELGAREKALLAEDPSLKHFKSHKNTVRRLKVVGDVLTVMVVAGCCYEIYTKAVTRGQARKEETSA